MKHLIIDSCGGPFSPNIWSHKAVSTYISCSGMQRHFGGQVLKEGGGACQTSLLGYRGYGQELYTITRVQSLFAHVVFSSLL